MINIITYVFVPKGLYGGKLYFLGIRTRFTDYSIALIALVFIERAISNIKKSRFILIITIALLNIILPFIATAIIGVVVFGIMLIILNKGVKISNKTIVTVFIIINILVVGFRIHTIFQGIIEDVLGKTMSLSGRTDIWDKSFAIIKDKMWFGHGYNNDGCFVMINNLLRQAHNQLLQGLYDGGIVSTVVFLGLLYSVAQKLDHNKGNQVNYIITSILSAYYLMMISEIYAYYPQFFVILIIGYNIHKIVKSKEVEDEKAVISISANNNIL